MHADWRSEPQWTTARWDINFMPSCAFWCWGETESRFEETFYSRVKITVLPVYVFLIVCIMYCSRQLASPRGLLSRCWGARWDRIEFHSNFSTNTTATVRVIDHGVVSRHGAGRVRHHCLLSRVVCRPLSAWEEEADRHTTADGIQTAWYLTLVSKSTEYIYLSPFSEDLCHLGCCQRYRCAGLAASVRSVD